MRTIGIGAILGFAVLTTAASVVYADAACRQVAREDYVACRTQCKQDFVDDRFTCGNVLPACGETCLAARQQCLDDVDLILESGVVRHCSVTTADACQMDSECPNGETCVSDGSLANCSGGTDACEAAFLSTAQSTCAATCVQGAHPACGCHGDATCMSCIDQAQVTRFLCRDGCGDSFRTNSTVQALQASCRSTFKACVQACPPAN